MAACSAFHRSGDVSTRLKRCCLRSLQDFINTLGQYYEIVVYTDEPAAYADPVINKLVSPRDGQRAICTNTYHPS